MPEQQMNGIEPSPGMSATAPPMQPKSSLAAALEAANRAVPTPEPETPPAPAGDMQSAIDEALADPAAPETAPAGSWSNDDIRDAVQALKRAGVPESVIRDHAERDLDTLVNWGLNEYEQRSARDDDFRRSREPASAREETGAPVEPTPTPSFSLPAKLKAKLDELEPGSASELEESIRAGLTATREEGMQQARVAENSALEFVRSTLRAEYPQLGDARQWARVKERAGKLVRVESFDSYEDVVRASARYEFGPGAKAARSPERSRELGMRRAGQVSTRVRSGAASKKFSQSDLIDHVQALQSRGVKGDQLVAQADAMRQHVDPSIRPKKPSWMNLPR